MFFDLLSSLMILFEQKNIEESQKWSKWYQNFGKFPVGHQTAWFMTSVIHFWGNFDQYFESLKLKKNFFRDLTLLIQNFRSFNKHTRNCEEQSRPTFNRSDIITLYEYHNTHQPTT